MENLNFDEAATKLEGILDELEGDTSKFTQEEIEEKVKEAENLRNHCKELLKKEKEEIIKTAKENNIPLEEIGISEEDLNAWISKWEEENANYTTADYITWWDGSNYRTHIIDADEYGATLKRVDDKLAREILSAYEKSDDWEDYGVGSKCRIGEFLFKTTRYPHFYEVEVIIGEEEED